MGNCIRHESQAQWGGEDWSPVLMTQAEKSAMKMEEEEEEMVSKRKTKCSAKSYTSTEVKIKITKKQLENLLGKYDLQHDDGLSVEQILAKLMKVSAHYETHQRSGWRPRLQSIPEV